MRAGHFCATADRLSQLREADKSRPWLYAIARNECLRCIRARGRERDYEGVPQAESSEPGADAMAARHELANLVAEAAGGLSDRDRSVLELAYRHGLDGPELAEALNVSAASAKKMTQRLRETVERSLGALLVSRGVRSDPSACPELGEILDGWDGQFSVLMRKRIARHIESCPVCDEERRRLVNPVALLGGVPAFIKAPDWLRDRTLEQIRLTSASSPADGAGDPDATQRADVATDKAPTTAIPSDVPDEVSRGSNVPAILAGLALVAVLVLCILWLTQRHTDLEPANVTTTQTPPVQAPRLAPPSSESPPPPSDGPVTTTIPAVTSVPPAQPTPPSVGSAAPAPPPPPPLPPQPPQPPKNGPSSYTSTAPVYTPSRPPNTPKPPDSREPSSSSPTPTSPSGGGGKTPTPPSSPPSTTPTATPTTTDGPVIF